MIRKTIIVLANSFKHHERCVAGRELLLVNGRSVLADWVRPVSNHDEGELTIFERVLTSSSLEVGVGDIVDVSLDHQPGDPTQPENWLLWQNCDWADASRGHLRLDLDALQEHPQSLWNDPAVPTDRARDAWLSQHPPRQSLYIVRADHLVVRLSCDAHGKISRRCRFDYGGFSYDLSLTDPEACRRLQGKVPRPGAVPVDVLVGASRICVSLARAFRGYHYKVVATIFEGL